MAWIESHQQTRDHPKVLDLKESMGWNIDETIGKLQRFWWWCLDHALDGDLSRMRPKWIGRALDLDEEEAEEFVKSMIQAQLLDTVPYLRVHNWWAHVGLFLQMRYKRHPWIWRRIKELYQDDDTSEQKKCSRRQPARTVCVQQGVSTARKRTVQPASDAAKHVHRPKKSTSPRAMRKTSKPPARADIPDPTDNKHPDRNCTVPHNLTKPNLTIPNHTNQHQHHQQHQQQLSTNAADVVDAGNVGGDGDGAGDVGGNGGVGGDGGGFGDVGDVDNPGRLRQQLAPITYPSHGAVAGTADPGVCTCPPPSLAIPGSDLKQMLSDRIGSKRQLSRFDLQKIELLRQKYGPAFFFACDFLHGGVTNAAAYLNALLTNMTPIQDQGANTARPTKPKRNKVIVVICDRCGTVFAIPRKQLEREAEAGHELICVNTKECSRRFSAQALLDREDP
jgi:hypothetical protein